MSSRVVTGPDGLALRPRERQWLADMRAGVGLPVDRQLKLVGLLS